MKNDMTYGKTVEDVLALDISKSLREELEKRPLNYIVLLLEKAAGKTEIGVISPERLEEHFQKLDAMLPIWQPPFRDNSYPSETSCTPMISSCE